MANLIRNKLNAHASKGQNFIEARVTNLNGIYLEARWRIERRIAQYVASGRNSFTGPRMVKLMEEVQAMFPEFEQEYRETAKEAITYIAQSYYRSALSDLSLKGSVADGINKDYLQLTLDDAYTHIAGATKKMDDYAIHNLRKLSSQVMREASLTGETQAQISKRLYAANCADGFFQFRASNGAAWNSEAYFDMLSRTLLHNSARESYLQGCADNNKDIVTIPPSGNPCPACANCEGRLYSISGTHPKYPSLQSAIDKKLFHPNCTHRVVAVSEVIAENMYDENGRPMNGINSPGNEEKDDKDAWSKYRQDQYSKHKKKVKKESKDSKGKVQKELFDPKAFEHRAGPLDKVLGAENVHLEAMESEWSNEVQTHLTDLQSKYKTNLKEVTYSPLADASGMADNKGVITFDLDDIKNKERYLKKREFDIKNNLKVSVPKENMSKYTSTHEFAHTVFNTSNASPEAVAELQVIFDDWKKGLLHTKEPGSLGLSFYAEKNLDEFFAEGFTRCILSPVGKNEKHVNAIGQFIKKRYLKD